MNEDFNVQALDVQDTIPETSGEDENIEIDVEDVTERKINLFYGN